MAVTYTSEPRYVTMSNLSGGSGTVFNGGEYESASFKCNTITPGYVGLYLDSNEPVNLSSACEITSLRITAQCRAYQNGFWSLPHVVFRVQGFIKQGNGIENYFGDYKDFAKKYCDNKNWSNSDISVNGLASCNNRSMILCFNLQFEGFELGNHERNAYIKNIKIGYTRTRACYITFKGDGVTESTTKYEYGTVPSYGSAPTRYGYTFKGWSDGSTTYSGTLPTAYEQDVIYTAVWEKTPCTITYDLNGGIAVNEDYKTQSGFIGESINLPKIYVGEGKQTEDMPFSKSCKVLFDYNYDNKTEFILSYAPLSGPISGWYTGDGTRVGGSGDSYTPRGDTTLHARWDNFNAINLISTERGGYTFLGWYTKLNGGERVGGSNDSYAPENSITLYAHWKRNSTNRIYIGTEKPKFYKGKKPIRSIYLGTSLIYRVFLPKISYDRIKTFGHLLVPLLEEAPKTYTLPEANLENAEGNVSYALYSDSKCKTPVGAGITFDENTRQVTISNAAKDTVATQDTDKDGLAKFYVKATYKNLSAIGEITLENCKVTATFSYRNNEGEFVDKTTKVYYGTSVEEFAKGITDFWLPENDENYHYTIIGWVDQNKKSTIKNVKGDAIFNFLFNAKPHEIDPTIAGYEKKVPTCTESGYIKGYCGYCAKQENGYKGLIQVDSPATGHKDTNGDNICDVCGEIFVDSGACGDNLTYTLDSNGVLTISGTGNMQDSSFGWDKNLIKSVIINDGVTSIGDSAFDNCDGLTSITIPDSVTSIGSSAFHYCTGLTSITIPNSVTSIGSSAFHYCTGLTSITIPNSVTSIGDSAFSRCDSLTSITIPDSVTSIGNNTFSDCYGLTSITIPNSVTSIGNSAFSRCTGLTSITIPGSVMSIGDYAFGYCKNLTEVNFSTRTNIPALEASDVFDNTPDSLVIKVPSDLVDQWKVATNWNAYADKIKGV